VARGILQSRLTDLMLHRCVQGRFVKREELALLAAAEEQAAAAQLAAAAAAEAAAEVAAEVASPAVCSPYLAVTPEAGPIWA